MYGGIVFFDIVFSDENICPLLEVYVVKRCPLIGVLL